jgi:hypothetical protein
MTPEREHYLAYMLRLWRIGEDGKTWRASLENAHTGARQGFANLNALLAFLEEKTDQVSSDRTGGSFSSSGEGQGRGSEPQFSE